MPPPLLLYSTNAHLKYHVQEEFRNQRHYVWCSVCADSSKQGAYTASRLAPPSSNPADIYRLLKKEVEDGDRHSSKILSVRSRLVALAGEWLAEGAITASQAEEITYLANESECTAFRPLLYVVPYRMVEGRAELVPASQRANPMAPEYRVKDLHRDEFDIVEL